MLGASGPSGGRGGVRGALRGWQGVQYLDQQGYRWHQVEHRGVGHVRGIGAIGDVGGALEVAGGLGA